MAKIYGKPLSFKCTPEKLLRADVYKRDSYTCVLCGKKAINVPKNYNGDTTLYTSDGWFEIDHIIPRNKGGRNGILNLQTVCNKCNCKKGGK